MSPPGRSPDPGRRLTAPYVAARRWAFAALVTATAVLGVGSMLDIVADRGITRLEVVILVLFALTFGWIAIAFWNAVIGFVLQAIARDPVTLERITPPAAIDPSPLRSRTALIMPAHNEDPSRVMNGLTAIVRSLDATGHGDAFDVFLLSDTTDADIARREEEAWAALHGRLRRPGMHYRRRRANTNRKAGNIEDFCRRWGRDYELMVVLDADSVMSGLALVELVRLMDANPRAGLIQTVPLPARRPSIFGRVLQFAACVHSPMLAAGQSFWQADAANYWGHNAIVRVAPFVRHCSLPVLPGRPPLGGSILSHDFVEAALMRRAGWGVYLVPSIGGSYEEVPGTIPDYATRDRRWTQGSLQHLRLLGMPGLHPASRVHFVLGAMGYVSSLLWLIMLLAGTAYVLGPLEGHAHAAGTVAPGATGLAAIVPLLLVTAALLFVPKLLALALALRRPAAFGGRLRLTASALLEMLFAIVIAPLMMLYHSRFVAAILAGRNVQWTAQARDGRAVTWSGATRAGLSATAFGLVWTGMTAVYSPAFVVWLTPILAGLLLAVPLIRLTSSETIGHWTRRHGLFLVPSETMTPPELRERPVPVLPERSADEPPHGRRTPAALDETVTGPAPP